jgi:hypothetical protein
MPDRTDRAPSAGGGGSLFSLQTQSLSMTCKRSKESGMTTTEFFDTPLRVVVVSRFRPALSGLSLSLSVSPGKAATHYTTFSYSPSVRPPQTTPWARAAPSHPPTRLP